MLGLMHGRIMKGEVYVYGTRNIWLSYGAWKTVEDILRSAEEGSKHGLNDEEEEGDRDVNTDYIHQTDRGLMPPPQLGICHLQLSVSLLLCLLLRQ